MLLPVIATVFVPIDYNFNDYDQIKAIFDALRITMPDLVFSFAKNHGIAPRIKKKKNFERLEKALAKHYLK